MKYELSAYELALINGGFVIIGAFIAALVGYWLSRLIAEHSARIQAAVSFREAFTKEQRLLSYESSADRTGRTAADIVKAAIGRHEIAMIRFKPFVCEAEIEPYGKAWKEYAGDSKHFEQYSGTNMFDAQKRRALALSRIEELLKFAEPKH